jgi:hypothetical protein
MRESIQLVLYIKKKLIEEIDHARSIAKDENYIRGLIEALRIVEGV